jgi:hypothetical protein
VAIFLLNSKKSNLKKFLLATRIQYERFNFTKLTYVKDSSVKCYSDARNLFNLLLTPGRKQTIKICCIECRVKSTKFSSATQIFTRALYWFYKLSERKTKKTG